MDAQELELDDTLDGGAGDDTYLFGRGAGKDTITETGISTDTLKLGAGVNLKDLMFDFSNTSDLKIGLTSDSTTAFGELTDQVNLKSYGTAGVMAKSIEKIVFSGGDTVDLAKLVQAISGFKDANSQVRLTSSNAFTAATPLLIAARPTIGV